MLAVTSILVCLFMLTVQVFQGSLSCTEGFIDRDLLERRAEKIGSGVEGMSSKQLKGEQFLVIPGMNFSCSGIITGLLLAVDVRNLTEPLVFELWRPIVVANNVTGYSHVDFSYEEIDINPGEFSTDGVRLYPIARPIRFQRGDIIGIFQPDGARALLFYTALAEQASPLALDINLPFYDTIFVNASGYRMFDGTLLIRPVTNNDACLNGFLSESELRQQTLEVNINGVVIRPRQQHLFPDIRFTCNGSITKWIVGAQSRKSTFDDLPEIQIWRRRVRNTYMKVYFGLLSPSNNESLTVYEYIPHTPVEFQAGDILGVYQPQEDRSDLLFYYQENDGPNNYAIETDVSPSVFTLGKIDKKFDYPLVTVEVTQVTESVSSSATGMKPSSTFIMNFSSTTAETSPYVSATTALIDLSSSTSADITLSSSTTRDVSNTTTDITSYSSTIRITVSSSVNRLANTFLSRQVATSTSVVDFPTPEGPSALTDTDKIMGSLSVVVVLLVAVIILLLIILIVVKVRRKRNMPSLNNSVMSLMTDHSHSCEYRAYNQTMSLHRNISYDVPVIGKHWITAANDQNDPAIYQFIDSLEDQSPTEEAGSFPECCAFEEDSGPIYECIPEETTSPIDVSIAETADNVVYEPIIMTSVL